MSDSTQENLYQAMDRLIRLSRVLPDTEMRLISHEGGKHYQIEVGEMPGYLRDRRGAENSEVVIRTTWTELVVWMSGVMKQAMELEENATDT